MGAIRLVETRDTVEKVLFLFPYGWVSPIPSKDRGTGVSGDPLVSSTWEEVPPENTLIIPAQCKALWRQFKTETEYTVSQAISVQEAYKRGNNWLPPPWAILAMFVLGFNEFMLLLRNPLYLVVLFVTFLLGKAKWVQMDIPGEFQNGILVGLITLSTRFFPTVMNLLRRLITDGHDSSVGRPSQPIASQIFRNQTQNPDSASNTISDLSVSTETGSEYSSPQLINRVTNLGEDEIS